MADDIRLNELAANARAADMRGDLWQRPGAPCKQSHVSEVCPARLLKSISQSAEHFLTGWQSIDGLELYAINKPRE